MFAAFVYGRWFHGEDIHEILDNVEWYEERYNIVLIDMDFDIYDANTGKIY